MDEITVYSKGYCPYCSAAKALLDAKGAEYTLIDVTTDAAARDDGPVVVAALPPQRSETVASDAVSGGALGSARQGR